MRCARVLAVVAAAIGTAGPLALAQRPANQPTRSQEVLRIGVDLVRVDATVTDARGRPVTDLTADDFEIVQDGKPRPISTFAFVRTADAPTESPAPAPVAPRLPVPRDQIRRTIAIVVDDLGLSFESMYRVREVLKKFLDTQMQRGDLVAILRTGAGSGALQQFTTDRRQLDAAIERIRFNLMARVSPFTAGEADRPIEEFRNEIFTAGTLGAISYVIRGVADLPGRKSVIVLSDGFRLTDADGTYGGRVITAMQSLVDAANRASVVIHTIDARGLVVTGPSAADADPETSEQRAEELRATQDGLGYLADETGGLFVRNNNDIGAGVRRVLDEQGYYLLGYVPDRATFETPRPRFHRLTVRVKRPGLRVRSRRGFLGVADRTAKPPTAASRMISAVTSPFAGGDVRLRLSSFFGYEPKTGAVALSVMHIDARDLTFTTDANGQRASEIEVLAVTFDEDGGITNQNSRRFTFRMPEDAYTRALERGFVYRIRVPLKKPGPYQLRVALRDVGADRIGSASQFIEVPDVKKGRLTLSGLVIDGTKAKSDADNAVEHEDPGATVAVRMFRQGTQATYFSEIYNAKRGKDGNTDLTVQSRMFRDGAEVFTSGPRPVERIPSAGGRDVVAGILQFGNALPPGSYLFEITVTDKLAKKTARATQTIDFEVVPAR
jgi:VWFA-related protein